MQARLIEANMEQNDGPLAEVGSLLDPLQEAWSQVEEPELAHAG
jgi:flagellin-specific chaperone FliS